MKLWYGRWVSNYKDGDLVIALMNSGLFKHGAIYFTKGRSDFYVLSNSVKLEKGDIFAVCPDNEWYKLSKESMFEAATKPEKRRVRNVRVTNPTVD